MGWCGFIDFCGSFSNAVILRILVYLLITRLKDGVFAADVGL
jgi:hypothetical protein